MNLCCVFGVEDYIRREEGSSWGYMNRGYGLDNSVVELLTRVAGVLGSIPSPVICFHCIYICIYKFYKLIPPFLLHYHILYILFREVMFTMKNISLEIM